MANPQFDNEVTGLLVIGSGQRSHFGARQSIKSLKGVAEANDCVPQPGEIAAREHWTLAAFSPDTDLHCTKELITRMCVETTVRYMAL